MLLKRITSNFSQGKFQNGPDFLMKSNPNKGIKDPLIRVFYLWSRRLKLKDGFNRKNINGKKI